jgi:hypothetical protein
MAVQPVQSASVPRKLSGIKCRMPGGLGCFSLSYFGGVDVVDDKATRYF